MITFASSTLFGLVDMGHRGPKGNRTIGSEWEATGPVIETNSFECAQPSRRFSSLIPPDRNRCSSENGFQQEVLGRTNRLLTLIRHGPHWKRRFQQFFYCCVCICRRGDVSTEPIGGFLLSRCLVTIRGDTQTHTHRETATWSDKPTLFFQNKETRLKRTQDDRQCSE
jgi:hypothetical protein